MELFSQLSSIQLKETTGDQILSKKSVKVKKRKSPSRMARDRNRLEAFLSKKAGSCNRDCAAAASTPPTTQCATPAATRRTVPSGRKLGSGIGGAGFEEEGAGIHCTGWRPGVGLGNSPIEQLEMCFVWRWMGAQAMTMLDSASCVNML